MKTRKINHTKQLKNKLESAKIDLICKEIVHKNLNVLKMCSCS